MKLKIVKTLQIFVLTLLLGFSANAAIVNVGDGSSNLIISGSYPAGTQIVVKPGTYNKGGGITISGLSNVTVDLTGVILDGLNHTSAGYYNILSLNNLINVTITNGTTQNVGYRSLYLGGRNVGLYIIGHTFSGNYEGCWLSDGNNTAWDGTDNTVALLNSGFRNCTFTNNSYILNGGSIGSSGITGLIKNFEFSGNTISGGNGGDYISIVCDNALVFNNTLKDINLGITNDNRAIHITGTAQIHDNTATNIGYSHFAAVWSVSFGTTIKTSNFYNNICNGSMKYSSFEFQEFTSYAIAGKTTYADLVIDNNTCSNLNTSGQTSWPAFFIDNYMFGVMGGHVTLTNNKGSNWLPVPPTGVYWNMAQPTVSSGNSYGGTVTPPPATAPSNLAYSPASFSGNASIAGNSTAPTINLGSGGAATYTFNATVATGISINASTGVISWNTTLASGTYSLVVKATNTTGSTTSTYTLTLNPVTTVVVPTVTISGAINIGWTVSNVTSVSYFSLEKSTTGTYSQLVKITPTASLTYSYSDATAVNGTNAYRVKVVLTDGTSFYSSVITY